MLRDELGDSAVAYVPLVDAPEVSRVKQAQVNADRGMIELPLPEKLVHRYSANDYTDMYGSFLGPMDVIGTWPFRYPGVCQNIFDGPGHLGPVIDATAEHWPVALLAFLMMGVASVVNTYIAYQAKKAEHEAKSESYKQIRKKLGLDPSQKVKKAVKKIEEDEVKFDPVAYNQKLREEIAKLNAALKKVLATQEDAPKIYEYLELTCPEKQNEKIELKDVKIRYQFKQKPTEAKAVNANVVGIAPSEANDPRALESERLQLEKIKKPSLWRKFVNKVVHPIYKYVSTASFLFWILWLGAAIATGQLADAAIYGIPNVVTFMLPFATALPYVGIKIRNWYVNRHGVSDEHARLTKIAESDTPDLLDKALREVEFQKEIDRLNAANMALALQVQEAGLTVESKLQGNAAFQKRVDTSTLANPGLKTAATFYTSTIGNYIQAQYNAWILGDFIKVLPTIACAIPFFGVAIGSALMAIGLGFGIYQAHKQYKEAKIEKLSGRVIDAIPLMTHFEERRTALAKKRHEIDLLCAKTREPLSSVAKVLDEPLPSAPKPMSTARKIYNCFDWSTTGIMFARILCTAGAAIFLPFVAVALSNPVTIALLAISGAVFLGAKIYQAYQKSKEAEARELTAKIKDMDAKMNIADMTIQNLEMKEKLQAKAQLQPELIEVVVDNQPKQQMTAAPTVEDAVTVAKNSASVSPRPNVGTMFADTLSKATDLAAMTRRNIRISEARSVFGAA